MRIKGINFKIHYSWYIIFVLMSYGLARSFSPSMSGNSSLGHVLSGVTATVVLFVCVLFHEVAHAFVAHTRGIKTESITLYFFGGLAEIEKEAHDAVSDLYISVAGPAVSFLLAGVFWVLSISPIDRYLFEMNLMIGIFNLLPVFPLDGGRVLRAVLWKIRDKGFLDAMRESIRIGRYVMYLAVSSALLWFVLKGEGLMLVMILGIVHFISNLYSKEVEAVSKREIYLKDVAVSREDMVCIDETCTVDEMFQKYFLVHGFHGFPVTDGSGEIKGMISYWWVKKKIASGEISSDTLIKDVYEPINESLIIRETETLAHALEKMYLEKRNRLLVISNNGKVTGLITKSITSRL